MFMDSRRSRHQGNGLSLFLDVWGLKWLGSWGERNLFQDCFFLHTSSMLAGMTKRWGGFTGTAGQSAYAQAHGHGSPKRVRLFTRQCSVWGWGEVHRGNVQRMILPKIWVEVEWLYFFFLTWTGSDFCKILLVKAVKCLPRFKGKKQRLHLFRRVSKHLCPFKEIVTLGYQLHFPGLNSWTRGSTWLGSLCKSVPLFLSAVRSGPAYPLSRTPLPWLWKRQVL